MTIDEEKKNSRANENDDDGDEEAQPPLQTGQAAEQMKALGSLAASASTNDESNKELDADSAAKAAEGVHSLQQAVQLKKAKKAERECALAAVKVAAADVDAVASEFDLKRPEAERCLREAGGDLRRALARLCGGGGGAAAV